MKDSIAIHVHEGEREKKVLGIVIVITWAEDIMADNSPSTRAQSEYEGAARGQELLSPSYPRYRVVSILFPTYRFHSNFSSTKVLT